MWSTISPYLTAILPTIIALGIFYVVMRAMLDADHRERVAQRRWESEQDAHESAAPEDQGISDPPSEGQ